MPSIAIRQSGGPDIASRPKAVVKTLGMRVGDTMNLSIIDNKIVLTPISEELTLGPLLAGSPKECFSVTNEYRKWLDVAPTGKEV